MKDLMLQPGLKSYTATIAGEKRTYMIEVPEGFNADNGIAMFFFKGKGGASPEKLTKLFSAALKKYNCMAIYPQAVKRGKAPAQWAVSGADADKDYQFFNHIAASIPDDLPVMLSGVSNGGCFALWLTLIPNGYATCTFAASLWRGTEDVEYPANVYAIHGKKDDSVPYYGGDAHGLDFYPAEESIKLFLEGPLVTLKTPYPGGAFLTTYEGHTKCQLLSVAGSGHDVMTSYKGISLIDSMIEFFRSFV